MSREPSLPDAAQHLPGGTAHAPHPLSPVAHIFCRRADGQRFGRCQLRRRPIAQQSNFSPQQRPATVLVKGMCTEYVDITGFENLTVQGLPGSTLVQPATIPTKPFISLLSIRASRSVLIKGFSFQSTSSSPPAIGIGGGSTNVRLRNLNIDGGSVGIIAIESSQVSIAGVTVRNAGWACVLAADESQLHVEDCLLDESSGTGWHEGIGSEASHVIVRRTTKRNMQVGLGANFGGEIGVIDCSAYYPAGGVTDVVIDNPAGTNFNGASIDGGASLLISTAKLRILNAGQTGGGNTGGRHLFDGQLPCNPGRFQHHGQPARRSRGGELVHYFHGDVGSYCRGQRQCG